MIPFIRRQTILEVLHQKEIAYIDDLVALTGVSDATIRRDLKTLEIEGQVDLLSGGAAKLKVHLGEQPLQERVNIHKSDKELIGRYAATLVSDGDFIYLGPGTTEGTMIRYLANKGITVVTTSAFHLPALLENKIDTIVLGGRIIHDIAVLSGPTTMSQLEKLRFDKCFIGGSGVSTNGVLMTSDENVAAVNRAVIQQTNTVYFLADPSKIGITSRFEFATMKPEHVLITTQDQPAFADEINYFVVE